MQPYGREGKKTLLDEDLFGIDAHMGCRIQMPSHLSCIIGASTNIAHA